MLSLAERSCGESRAPEAATTQRRIDDTRALLLCTAVRYSPFGSNQIIPQLRNKLKNERHETLCNEGILS